jgi:hypothetical protein
MMNWFFLLLLSGDVMVGGQYHICAVLMKMFLFCFSQNAMTDMERVQMPPITEYWKVLAEDVSQASV